MNKNRKINLKTIALIPLVFLVMSFSEKTIYFWKWKDTMPEYFTMIVFGILIFNLIQRQS